MKRRHAVYESMSNDIDRKLYRITFKDKPTCSGNSREDKLAPETINKLIAVKWRWSTHALPFSRQVLVKLPRDYCNFSNFIHRACRHKIDYFQGSLGNKLIHNPDDKLVTDIIYFLFILTRWWCHTIVLDLAQSWLSGLIILMMFLNEYVLFEFVKYLSVTQSWQQFVIFLIFIDKQVGKMF